MTGRTPPVKPSPVHRAILAEVKRVKLSGYALQKATGMPLRTVQRFINGEGSPTLATVETVAAALGLVVKVEPKG